MINIALVTYNDKPNLIDGEKLLLKSFKKYGFVVFEIPWDKRGVVWENFDLVILRTCWNYHLQIHKFLDWLNCLEKKRVNLWNPVSTVRWNINKKYLLDLEKIGIPIIPSLIFNKETINNIKKVIINNHWEEVVIKPAIGASSYKIERIKSKNLTPENPYLTNILNNSNLLIQPFLKEIQTDGEYSFIFFNNIYSHTILKRPKAAEYRTNIKYGGTGYTIEPNQNLISQAQKILDGISSPLLYDARVDCVIINEQLYLMELELIEPYLFFEKDKESAEKFVKAAIELRNKYPQA